MESLKLSDEFLNIEEEEKESWKIDNDLLADWALDKIRESKAEYERFRMVAQAKIEQLQSALDKEKEKMERETGFFENKLYEYFNTVCSSKARETKTQKVYRLPSGTLKLKYRSPQFRRNDKELVAWLENNKLDEFVKVKKSADWARIKNFVMPVGDKVVTEATGEVVDGVEVLDREPEFKVEVEV